MMAEEEINLLEYVSVINKRRILIIALVCMSLILSAAISLLLPAKFKATATIIIPQKEGRSVLAQMASGFSGVLPFDLAASGIGRSPNFVDILESETITGRVVDLLKLERVFPKYKEKWKLEKDIIKKMLSVDLDKKGNVITVNVETDNPSLSASMANAYLLCLDEYNQKSNLYVARRMSSYIMQQLIGAKYDLNAAEEKLKDFEVESRMVTIAEKELKRMRLLRDVKIKEEIYKLLSAEYEKSIFDERKDTQFFEVLDPAKIPKEKSRPKIKLNILIAGFSSLFFGIFLAFFLEYLEGLGVNLPEMEDFQILGGGHDRKHSR